MRIVTDPNDFLKAPQRFLFSYSLISSVVSSLTPSTPIIFIGSQNLAQPQQSVIDLPRPQSLSLIEPIYGTQYQVRHAKGMTSSVRLVYIQGLLMS